MIARGIDGRRRYAAAPAFRTILLVGSLIGVFCVHQDNAMAQLPGSSGLPTGAASQPNAQMFLVADTVTYDSKASVVTASGGVQIDYGAYKLVARKVVYNQKTKRLIASGDVQLKQPDGNTVYSDTVDITDNFRDGFVRALRIETPEDTRFAAQSAVRENGNKTTFKQGVYTACHACIEHPDRAPLWQVKARKIVWDQQEKEIRYYGARFEFFGAPLAYLPYFSSPDPTVKRKSGFLTPTLHSSNRLGYGVRIPYFLAIAPDKDATLSGTYYTKQGFLAEAEYRQAVTNGIFTLKTAGIVQQDRDAFKDQNYPEPHGIMETPDFANTDRGMIGTTGRFALTDRWTLGWSLLLQSDKDFSNTYAIENFSDPRFNSEIYLTGLGDQSYFDLRGQKFHYQTIFREDAEVQPLVAPVFDYERIEQEPMTGGEVKFNANVTSLTRDEDFAQRICAANAVSVDLRGRPICSPAGIVNGYFYDPNLTRYYGLKGSDTRGSANVEWRDQYTLESGLVLKPTLALRGDLYTADMSADGFENYAYAPTGFGPDGRPIISVTPFRQGAIDLDDTGARGMATAAIEARYPYLIETENTSSIIEPIAQFIARPDETAIGSVPNEDAQSLTFNTANLFELDKFSGYDRIEGGTRANVGLRYAGVFGNGYTVDAVVGQSYQLAGLNSFAQRDTALVGYNSGLQDDISDYVSSVSVTTPIGVGFGTLARFDHDTFDVNRTDVYGSYANAHGSAAITYTDIAAQPVYASLDDRQQVSVSGSVKFLDDWTAYGTTTYDLKNDAVIEKGFGAGYQNECFSLLASYTDQADRYTRESTSSTFRFTLNLRTISNFTQSVDLGR